MNDAWKDKYIKALICHNVKGITFNRYFLSLPLCYFKKKKKKRKHWWIYKNICYKSQMRSQSNSDVSKKMAGSLFTLSTKQVFLKL